MSEKALVKAKEWIRINLKLQSSILKEYEAGSHARCYLTGVIFGLELALTIIETQEKIYRKREE